MIIILSPLHWVYQSDFGSFWHAHSKRAAPRVPPDLHDQGVQVGEVYCDEFLVRVRKCGTAGFSVRLQKMCCIYEDASYGGGIFKLIYLGISQG